MKDDKEGKEERRRENVLAREEKRKNEGTGKRKVTKQRNKTEYKRKYIKQKTGLAVKERKNSYSSG